MLVVCLHVSAAGYGQNGTVTISGRDLPLEKVFSVIKKQTDYVCFYGYDVLKDAKPVSLSFKDAEVQEVLKAALWGQGLDFSITGRTITITKKSAPIAVKEKGPGKVFEPEGVVTNEDGEPLAGASVKLKNGNVIAITDEKGRFKLKNISGDATIEISFTGYSPQSVKIDNRESLKVFLSVATNQLDQVQVVAYGTSTQRLNTGNVTKVTSKEIEQQPVSNALAALEGRVPGLFITQSNGNPGGGFTVRIRGQNSISSGNDPFYVVDGVPYPSQTQGSINGVLKNPDGTTGSPLNYINPSDIESVEVLKDADATSIYGSRAANGAILITTKKGKAGKMKIDINTYAGFAKVTREAKLLNTQEYLGMRHEAFYNDSIADPSANIHPTKRNAPDLLVWDTTRYTDWQKVLLGNAAHYTDAEASISGGTTNTQYLLGGGYHRETSVFPVLLPGQGSDERASAHFNLLTSSENKKFKISLNSNYASDRNRIQATDYTGSAFILPPDAPAIYNSDGTLNWAPTTPGGRGTWSNPFAILRQKYKGRTSNLVSNALISYNLLPGLEVKTSLGYTNTQTDEVWTAPTTSLDPALPNLSTRSFSQFNITNTHSWIVEPQADYRVNLGKGGILSALAGMTFHVNNTDVKTIVARGFINDALLEDIGSASTLTQTSTSAEYKYNAVFGRLNYNLQDKYILNLTARRDGSSRFGPGKQFANFESIGAAWIFSGEDFFKQKLSFLSFGKIRASYGTSGNDVIGDYKFLDLYSTTTNPYQGIQGIYPMNLFNPDLAWELDKKMEGGLELGFLKDRILINASYFRNRSGNQLLFTPLSLVTGFSSIPSNLPAVVQNTGVEIVLNTVNVKNKIFFWRSSFNITIPRNKLVSFSELINSLTGNVMVVGLPIGIVKAYHFLGVNDSTGIYQFATSKGEPTYNPTYGEDNTVVISTMPKFYGGFQNSFKFKGFNLDFLFQFVKQTGANMFYTLYSLPGAKANQPSVILDHWQKPGDKKTFQQFSQDYSGNAYNGLNTLQYSDFVYSDASYIRLKNLSFSYTIPMNWQKQMHLQNLRVYIQGQNLLTITNYKGNDPENQGNTVPPMRIWTAGFQITL